MVSGILSDISSTNLFQQIFWHFLPGRWGPALPTPFGSSPDEARRCPLRSGAPGVRSGAAHCNLELPGEGPAANCNLELPG